MAFDAGVPVSSLYHECSAFAGSEAKLYYVLLNTAVE